MPRGAPLYLLTWACAFVALLPTASSPGGGDAGTDARERPQAAAAATDAASGARSGAVASLSPQASGRNVAVLVAVGETDVGLLHASVASFGAVPSGCSVVLVDVAPEAGEGSSSSSSSSCGAGVLGETSACGSPVDRQQAMELVRTLPPTAPPWHTLCVSLRADMPAATAGGRKPRRGRAVSPLGAAVARRRHQRRGPGRQCHAPPLPEPRRRAGWVCCSSDAPRLPEWEAGGRGAGGGIGGGCGWGR
jgi:hypothetical protein